MAIIVVGGSNKGVGKTALVCGLIAAMPEFCWTAVKITAHEHGKPESIWEETELGQGSDTARYLTAGAARAFLMTAAECDIPILLSEFAAKSGPGANVIFESNRILEYLRPEVCLMVSGGAKDAESKHSFSLAAGCADAMVARMELDRVLLEASESRPSFHLAELERVSPEMLVWLGSKLSQAPRF